MDGGGDSEAQHGPRPVADGEFKGWMAWNSDAFENLTGPFYFRQEADGSIRCAFRAGQRHLNGAGAMHGGCMMTFADFCLFAFAEPARRAEGGHTPMVTIALNGEFIGPAFEGDLIEATGEVVRAGGSLMFLRGLIETGGKPMMSFSGVIKKVKRRAP